jgi:predicted transglutaminase-like cysteine proteinase
MQFPVATTRRALRKWAAISAACVLVPALAFAAPGGADREPGLSFSLGTGWSLRPTLPDRGLDVGAAFGPDSRVVDRHGATQRWEEVRVRAEQGEPWLRRCIDDDRTCASGAMHAWAALMRQVAHEPAAQQVRLVNRGVNMLLAYRTDQAVYGRDEYWASPIEALANGAGDCEDYAILKLWSLKLLGIDAEKLALVVVYDPARHENHAILSILGDRGRMALDSHHAMVLPMEATPYRPLAAAGYAGQAVYDPTTTARLAR